MMSTYPEPRQSRVQGLKTSLCVVRTDYPTIKPSKPMAFASGNVLHYLRLYNAKDKQGISRFTADVVTHELESEILLIRCTADYCVAVTQEYVHVVDSRYNRISRVEKQDNIIVDAAIWGHIGVLLITTNAKLMILYHSHNNMVEIDTGRLDIISVYGVMLDAYALSSELIVFDINRGLDGNISFNRSSNSRPLTSDRFRLASYMWLWNEDCVYDTDIREFVVIADELRSRIVSCCTGMGRLFVLTEDGNVRDAWPNQVVETGCNKICVVQNLHGFVLLGVNDSGEASVIIGPKIKRLPSNVTLVSGELYVPRLVKRVGY